MTARLGARVAGDGVRLRVWAPRASQVELVPEDGGGPTPLEPTGDGFFEGSAPLGAGARYRYRVDGGPPMPDPASRFQPEGAHGPSQVIDPQAYCWTDQAWRGVPRRELVFYELHVGTFTPEGTFAAARTRLDELVELGITAIELMPVNEFPGRWSWGYDQAALYAPSRAYGTPDDLRALVDVAHAKGLAVFLDVVHNHVGPDGAYVAAYGPLHSEAHHTPWGAAINLDGEHSRGVRDLLIDSALHWLREYHVDGLRLDAVFALRDDSDDHFLAELARAVATVPGPRRLLIAEDERNLRTVVDPQDAGGYGLDAVWADDFHHQIRNLTAGDTQGYYAPFAETSAADVCATLRQGWFHTGRGGGRGTDPAGLSSERFVLCIQNHDQVGNRPDGARLHHEISADLYRAASALLILAPELPLLFMGQEWAASTPFLFFSDHHPELGRLVTAGRRAELRDVAGFHGEVPDPQAPETFARSRLRWEERATPGHARVLALYRDLLALRRDLDGASDDIDATPHGDRALTLRRGHHHVVVSFASGAAAPRPRDAEVVLHTEDPRYAGAPAPPIVEDDRICFPRPAAVVLRH